MIEKEIKKQEKEINEKEINQLKNDIKLIIKACMLGILIVNIIGLCSVIRILIGV